jgi:mannose-6-phosphate isomerase-like protein (cupin superfamily)
VIPTSPFSANLHLGMSAPACESFSHSVDEVYYIIEGNGFIKLDGKRS